MALTLKEQHFARVLASGKFNQTEAYTQAYDTAKISPAMITDRASRLASKPEVMAEVKVLTERATLAAVTAAAYTIDKAIEECNQVLELAKENKQSSAAVAAVKLKSQLAGHVLDRKEISDRDPLKDATNDELVKLRAEIDARLSAGKAAAEVTEAPIVVPAAHIVHQIGAKEERRALN